MKHILFLFFGIVLLTNNVCAQTKLRDDDVIYMSVENFFNMLKTYCANKDVEIMLLRNLCTSQNIQVYDDIKLLKDVTLSEYLEAIPIDSTVLTFSIDKRKKVGQMIAEDTIPMAIVRLQKTTTIRKKKNTVQLKVYVNHATLKIQRIALDTKENDATDDVNKISVTQYIDSIKNAEAQRKLAEAQRRKAELDKQAALRREQSLRTYDYSVENRAEYNAAKDRLQSLLAKIFTGEDSYDFTVQYSYQIDSFGKCTVACDVPSNIDSKLGKQIKDAGLQISFKALSKNGFLVNGFAKYLLHIAVENQKVKIKKQNYETIITPVNVFYTTLKNKLEYAPQGNFTFNTQEIKINNESFSRTQELRSASCIGGPLNAFKSVLVPGWGMSSVTDGKKNGIITAASVYGLIAVGAGLKIYSNSQYNDYQMATQKTQMDSLYSTANTTHKLALACFGTAAAIWIYDIAWVAVHGFQNRAEMRKYKRNFSFYYNPANNQSAVAYRINF